jgi:hypothetical protein
MRCLFKVGAVMACVAAVGLWTTQVSAAIVYTVDATSSSVSAHNSGDGLLIETSIVVPNGYGFLLNGVGDTHTFDFFRIWTDETWVNADDTVPKPISATLAFSQPPSDGTVAGETVGLSVFSGFYQAGQVTWTAPTLVNVPGGYQYQITLSDEVFNEGLFWLGLGHKGATVTATIEQIAVPLPAAAWAGITLLAMCAAGKLRRRTA